MDGGRGHRCMEQHWMGWRGLRLCGRESDSGEDGKEEDEKDKPHEEKDKIIRRGEVNWRVLRL